VIGMQNSFLAIENCSKPVIIAIHGKAIGGAVDLMCSCDIRYATADTEISIKEVDIGMAADLGTLQRMGKLVGNDSWMRELAFTGRWATAQECHRFGLFGNVYPDKPAMMEAALALAKQIAGKSPVATMSIKKVLSFSRDHSVRESLDYTRTWNNMALQTNDMMIAISANLGKTTPEFPKL
jgi:enoyl-CoA hydratase/carnithine racemase